MDTTQNVDRLAAPPKEIVDRLATEARVIEHDVRVFSTQLDGLTMDEAIILLDELSYRRSWNMDTYMAAAEIIDAARQSTN